MLTADLQNTSLWEQVYYTTVNGNRLSQAIIEPIPDLIIPTYLSSNLIAVYSESNNAPIKWRTSGWLTRYISVGLSVGNNQNTKIGYSERVPLNNTKVIQFNGLGENYKLVYTPYKKFTNISFGIWKYTGEITETLQQQLDLARIDVLRTERKIDLLLRGII